MITIQAATILALCKYYVYYGVLPVQFDLYAPNCPLSDL